MEIVEPTAFYLWGYSSFLFECQSKVFGPHGSPSGSIPALEHCSPGEAFHRGALWLVNEWEVQKLLPCMETEGELLGLDAITDAQAVDSAESGDRSTGSQDPPCLHLSVTQEIVTEHLQHA